MIEKLILLILAIILVLSITVYAASDTVTIEVNVSTLTQITVTPDYLNFTQTTPGSQPSTTRTLTIKNTGSTDVKDIYVTIDTSDLETTNPIGTGNIANYATGGFITIKNSTGTGYYWLGRLEWNDTVDSFSGASFPTTYQNISRGWIRNATQNFLFSMTNGTSDSLGLCNDTGTEIRIEQEADTGAASTRDLTGSGYDTCLLESTGEEYSIHTCPSTNPLGGMCVAAWADCTRIMIYQWDYNSTSSRYSASGYSCTNKTYVSYDTYDPSDSATLTVMAWVPKGTPSGNATTSTLWITASAA